MTYLIVASAALAASCLTLFSGFGLGTLLMPVVALFFPLDIAVAITAIVHFSNNVFKFLLLGRQSDPGVILRFGLPAILAALIGAWLLGELSGLPPLHSYVFAGHSLNITPVKLVIGVIILAFVVLEVVPRFAAMSFDPRLLPLGGAISGFFGGLSGHQGAFRSMFLLKSGLDKERFVATGVVLAMIVDVTRMAVYGFGSLEARNDVDWTLVLTATLAAFAGAFVGTRLVKKLTIRSIQMAVSTMLVLVGVGLIAGLF